MNNSFAQDRYAFIPQLFDAGLIAALKGYYKIQLGSNQFHHDDQCPLSWSVYGDPLFDALLVVAADRVKQITEIDVVPTYSYARSYVKGDVLERHKDRPACQVSVTATIGVPEGEEASVIFVKRPDGEEIAVSMKEGDACVYMGEEVEHWRDPIPRHGFLQVFLHYIDKNGPHYPAHRTDGRPRLGIKK